MRDDTYKIGQVELPIWEEDVETKHYIPEEEYYLPVGDYLEEVADAVKYGENVLIEGEQGCGKSALVLHLAAKCKAPLIQIQGSGEMSEVDLVGGFQNTEKGMQWVDGLIPYAFKNKCWLLLDEISMALPEVLARLHSVLDSRRHLDLREINQLVMVHPGTVIFATMNPHSGRHVGTKPLSPALLSRFHVVVPYDFMSATEEAKLLIERVGCIESEAKAIVEVANTSRKAFRSSDMSELIDTRMLIRWAEKAQRFKKYYDIKEGSTEHFARAVKTTILSRLDEKDIGVLKAILMAHNLIKA